MSIHLQELTDGSDAPETITLDLSDEEVKKFRVGQKVKITIKGSVGMLQVPPNGSSVDDPALMGIRMTSKDIQGFNEFAELAEDAEEEEDDED